MVISFVSCFSYLFLLGCSISVTIPEGGGPGEERKGGMDEELNGSEVLVLSLCMIVPRCSI